MCVFVCVLLQVRRRLPQPQHGSETARTDVAGLQAAAVQSGKIRRERENGARHGQTAPGTLFAGRRRRTCRSTPPAQGRGVRGHVLLHVARIVNRAGRRVERERHKCWLDRNENSWAHAYCTCARLHPRKLAALSSSAFSKRRCCCCRRRCTSTGT